MIFTEADIDCCRLSDDHRHYDVDQKAGDGQEVKRRMMPGQFALQFLVGGRVALDTAIRQQRLFGHYKQGVVTPNGVHAVRRRRKIRLLWGHTFESFWEIGRVEVAWMRGRRQDQLAKPSCRKDGKWVKKKLRRAGAHASSIMLRAGAVVPQG